jgi:hypothetical protein
METLRATNEDLEDRLSEERQARLNAEVVAAGAMAASQKPGSVAHSATGCARCMNELAAAKAEAAALVRRELERNRSSDLTLKRTRALLTEALEELQRSKAIAAAVISTAVTAGPDRATIAARYNRTSVSSMGAVSTSSTSAMATSTASETVYAGGAMSSNSGGGAATATAADSSTTGQLRQLRAALRRAEV